MGHDLAPDIRLWVILDGTVTRPPALLTIVELRQTLLIDFDFEEDKVNLICRKIEMTGQCRLGQEGNSREFLLEKIAAMH